MPFHEIEKSSFLRLLKNFDTPTSVFCILSQIAGTGIQVSGDKKLIATGTKIILAGLIFQEVMLILFVCIAFNFKNKVRTDRPLSRHIWVFVYSSSPPLDTKPSPGD